jgi:hypothetical protein
MENKVSTKQEKNTSKNHTGKPSDNTNTQHLQQKAKEMKNQSRDLKPESDYEKGAHDDIGQDARKSRDKAEEFQKSRPN